MLARRMKASLVGHQRTGKCASRVDSRSRCASIVVELIVMLPILLILLAAVVEFGCIFTVSQNVAYAARSGAKLASEQPSLGQALSLAGNGQLRAAINHQLETAGLPNGVCSLTLEHNGADSPKQVTDASSNSGCNCSTPATTLPTPAVALRLTICVPLEGNVPDLLSSFGFCLAGRKVRESATFRLESGGSWGSSHKDDKDKKDKHDDNDNHHGHH